ncbi:MAG TPA: AcvB/VirJ family lysyl-phosphatidylglycerol hydrolase [Steroidobacteraceae bacterium]|jgi:type IV secretory pathway VirJ component|nr:AcvB/VirJ family lysyl-phosphatidylglycerol hydrolase [Steroidobacteraceae bacterium]
MTLRRLLNIRLLFAALMLSSGAVSGPVWAAPATLSHGRFHDLAVYAPAGKATSFVLFLSGDEGWNSGADALAEHLVQQGAMVVGIDLPKFKAVLEADGGQCVFPDGDLENLSHFVQAYFHNATYLAPLLVGVSAGGAMAYAVLAQAPKDTFGGALSLGFCPTLNLGKPLCKGSGLEFTRGARGTGVTLLPISRLGSPWVIVQPADNAACPVAVSRDFVSKVHGAAMALLPEVNDGPSHAASSAASHAASSAASHAASSAASHAESYGASHAASQASSRAAFGAAFAKLAAANSNRGVPAPPAALGDLPVIEVPASSTAEASDAFAIIMSGDGGWAGLDQDIAAALSARGIPVVGLDSLRYFWTARTPDSVAADTDRMIRYYLAHFGKKRVLLVGYSQGADVLPFAVNRLPDATKAYTALMAILGMSEHALFEFHVSSWISDDTSGPATLPEVNRIIGMPVLCIYGEDEHDSLCPKLDPTKFNVVKVKGGHHFDGNYAALADDILAAAKP